MEIIKEEAEEVQEDHWPRTSLVFGMITSSICS